jgi:hypothetical protein
MPDGRPENMSGLPATAARFQVISMDNDDGFRVREYKKRQAHKKTRLGCKTCKLKKVKVNGNDPLLGQLYLYSLGTQ